MIAYTDTCFWNHVKEIFDSLSIDLRIPLFEIKCGMTKAVEEEIIFHRLDSFVPINQMFKIPVSEQEINDFLRKYPSLSEFDYPDQTLIVVGRRDNAIILTDDGELFIQCQALNIYVLLLPQFLLFLVNKSIFKKTEVYRCIRFWEENGRYKARDLKKWSKILAEIT